MLGLGGLWSFLTGAAIHEGARGVIKNGLEKAAGVIIKRGEDLIKQNPREDYTEVLRHLEQVDPVAARCITDAQQQATDAGVENLFVVTLGSYIPHDETGKVRMAEAVERFAWLGGKDEPEFNLAVEGLKHDPVAQFIRHWILGKLAVAWSFIDGAAGRLADELRPYAENLAARAAKKPTWRSLWLDL